MPLKAFGAPAPGEYIRAPAGFINSAYLWASFSPDHKNHRSQSTARWGTWSLDFSQLLVLLSQACAAHQQSCGLWCWMSHWARHGESICSSCLDVGLIPCRCELLAPAQPLLAKLFTLYNLEALVRWLRWECFGASVLEAPKLAELRLSRGQAGPAPGAVSLLTLCPPWSEQAPRPPGHKSKLLFAPPLQTHLSLSFKETHE